MTSNQYFHWNFPDNGETTIFDEIRFPITINETEDVAGLFFAWQWHLPEGGQGFYTGIQPWSKENTVQDDPEPEHYARMLFSSFNYDTKTEDEGFCKGGADGDPKGVTCLIKNANLVLDKTYTYRVTQEVRDGRQYWTGTAWDEAANVPLYHIGTYYFEGTNRRYIRRYSTGFIEPFSAGDKGRNCTVTFGRPVALFAYKKYIGNKISLVKVDDDSKMVYTVLNETEDDITIQCRLKEGA